MLSNSRNTSELTDAALDWAVAKCLTLTQQVSGFTFFPFKQYLGTPKEVICGWGVYLDPPERDEFGAVTFEPSSNWSQGGPIIERERIEVRPGERSEGWFGSIHNVWMFMPGPTPLIAAMRCFVASKLGDVIKIPKELL